MLADEDMFSTTSGRIACRVVANQGERPLRKSACSVSAGSRTLITILKLGGRLQKSQRNKTGVYISSCSNRTGSLRMRWPVAW
jgi:hypothetical protein